MDVGVIQRRHNPVDSICRKLQNIQRRDQELNSPFQIPKFQSRSYDSPQPGLRRNLEAILKKRAVRSENEPEGAPSPAGPVSSTCNSTFTVAGGSADRRGGQTCSLSCSTPAAQTGGGYFSFSCCDPSAVKSGGGEAANGDHRASPAPSMLSYDLNFCTSESSTLLDCDLGYSALVVRRLSMGDGTAARFSSESRKETMSEVSLICEEDLLDTIFHACDTQRRGKVYVSHIVDYLRHTTSRGSEDSGLEELCNMLDPEQKDVSIDLDTYHAIMKEWIEDCRNQGDRTPEDLMQESVKLRDGLSARRSAMLNMTSGSLEAFGGEASRGDLETSDLVYCVADLQFNNQKLQEEVRKLKQALEALEETNNRLMEDNECLKTQAKIGQQSVQKEKLLKEEMEEMKASLSASEESRARVSAQGKYTERENQCLISKIASLQDENLKVTLEIDDLQKKMIELCDLNADLQVQIHSFDGVMNEKDTLIREKSRQMKELQAAVEEYSSLTELLREDKAKLESQVQMMQPDMGVAGLSLSVAYRLNQTNSGSLQTELALAQNPPEGQERLSTSLCFASPLDETLDREVLLLLQGPTPEQMSVEFKALLCKLSQDFKEDSRTVLNTIKKLAETQMEQEGSKGRILQALQADLERKRRDWTLSLQHLEQYTDSLEKELIKMASNMRRSRTEILHLSVRVQEQESQKRQLSEELDQLRTPHQDCREAGSQTEEPRGEESREAGSQTEEPRGEESREAGSQTEEPRGEESREAGSQTEEPRGEESREAGSQTEEPRGEESREAGSQTEEPRGEESREAGSQTEEPRGEESREAGSQTEEPQEEESREASSQTEENPQQVVAESGVPLWDREDEENSVLDCEPRVSKGEGEEEGQVAEEEIEDRLSVIGTSLSQSSERGEHESIDTREGDTRGPFGSREQEGHVPESTGPEIAHQQAVQTAAPRPDSSQSPNSHTQLVDALTLDDLSPHPRLGPPQLGCSLHNLVVSLGHASPDQGGMIPFSDRFCTPLPGGRVGGTRDTAKSSMSLTQNPDQPPAQGSPLDCLQPTLGMEMLVGKVATETAQTEADVTDGISSSEPMAQSPQHPKNDSLTPRGRFKRELELSHSMQAIVEHKGQEDLGDVFEKEGDSPINSEDVSDVAKEDGDNLSSSEKEIETEFHRLSLGFKCDIFTLEKRLRLEERSRDLAEDNMKKEVSSCQKLLQVLVPLCEDDNQSMEIIQRLQKNLEVLTQSMSRVSSRSELLGAIHQENRVGKAVEVMIQHVENLRRMYTKEHAELMELKESLVQSERSFGSHAERDDFRSKKMSGSQYYKPSGRRVSIAAIPRNSGGTVHFDAPKPHDGLETEADKLARRSSWGVTGKSTVRPMLKRFISAETDEPSLTKGPEQTASRRTEVHSAGPKSSWGLWVSVALVLALAGLLALLTGLALAPAVEAAPVGPGDSWVTIQQLLWPYTGLRHNGQPPV